MKKIRNIVPLTLGGTVIEPGMVFEYNINFKEYRVSTHSCVGWITDKQASDRRLFEPVEERFIRKGEPYRAITATGEVCNLHFWDTCLGDAQRFACGNVFRVDTNLNAHGVHIDDALKVLKLALRVPRLWHTLKDCLGTDERENEQVAAVYGAMLEIEAASQPGGCA